MASLRYCVNITFLVDNGLINYIPACSPVLIRRLVHPPELCSGGYPSGSVACKSIAQFKCCLACGREEPGGATTNYAYGTDENLLAKTSGTTAKASVYALR